MNIFRGEVWWVRFDDSTGSEIQKTRPAVVVSNDTANRKISRIQVVPLTTNVLKFYPSDALVTLDAGPRRAMANQITTVSKERVGQRVGKVSPRDLEAIEAAIKIQLGFR